MPVRTLQIAIARNLATGVVNVLYTVPANKTLIVKDVRITNPSGSLGDANLAVRRAGVVTSVMRAAGIPATSTVERTAMFVVLEPGDELIASTGTADMMWLVSGSLLGGVAEE